MTDEVKAVIEAGDAPATVMGAFCGICDAYFGWRCPDTLCHYFTINGRVELIDQTKVDAPLGHDPNHETEDSCIYCGKPEERM